jgi:CRP/FNR family transcriptional regulator, nitrogen oxide reductase regulator
MNSFIPDTINKMSGRRKTPLKIEPVEPAMCSLDMRLDILRKVPFFAMLSGKDIQKINQQFTERGYEPQQLVYFSGDQAERLFVAADGYIKLLQYSETGKTVLLDIITPGEFFGSLSTLSDDEYPDTAQALSAACVLSINKKQFRKILEDHPPVALTLLDVTHQRLRVARETVRQLSSMAAERRLAHTLLNLADKLGVEAEVGWLIQAPLSREDLSQMTGTTPETTSRVLSQLQKDGLIHSGRQWIAISNRDKLEKLASSEPYQ